MTDWEDAGHGEMMARLDAALERIQIDGNAELGVHLDRLFDESPTYAWPPPPNTAHPGLAEQAGLVRDLIATGRDYVYLQGPRKSPARFITDPLDSVDLDFAKQIQLTVNRCWALGVHVGEPYVWMWKVATDEHKRWVSTDSWPEYHPGEPWRRP